MEFVKKLLTNRYGPLATNLFFFAQVALFISIAVAGLATAGSASTAPIFMIVTQLFLALLAVSVLALLAPWHRISPRWLLLVGVADIAVVALLRVEMITLQPRLSIIILIPAIWLSFSFGIWGLIIAIVGDFAVAFLPNLLDSNWPSSSIAWGQQLLVPAVIALIAVSVALAARRIRRGARELVVSDGLLKVSVDQLLDADSMALAVLSSVDAGIIFYAPDGEVLLTNDRGRALMALGGNPSLTHIGNSPHVYEADGVTPIDVVDRTVVRAAQGTLVRRQTSWIGNGDAQRAVISTSQYVRRASGELIGTVISMQDVTELAAAVNAKDEFLKTMSHELRTPLTSILGYLELIEDSFDLEEFGMARDIATIHRNSRRLLGLITALLAEVEGTNALTVAATDISELMTSRVESTQEYADSLGVTIGVAVLQDVVAEVDRGQIGSVIDNLLSNSIKFTGNGGFVTVSVLREGATAVVRVSDTGIGIPDAERDHIFEPFFRGAVARSSVNAGSGLGLSTAKLIVGAHHGTIESFGVPSGGTTIEMRLPLLASLVPA